MAGKFLRYVRRGIRTVVIGGVGIIFTAVVLTSGSFALQGPNAPILYSTLTANNTSAASSTAGRSQTANPSDNVSKASLAAQLPPGSRMSVYARYMTWFGTAGHADVGYSSNDATQVRKQIADMRSRGISGVVVNWHGPSDPLTRQLY